MHGHLQANEESSRFWEEKRLMFLLGSTSILFFVCIMPQLVLSLMIHEDILKSYYFQVPTPFTTGLKLYPFLSIVPVTS